MSADLHIHVITDECTEDHVAIMLSNTLGTRFFDGFFVENRRQIYEKEHGIGSISTLVNSTPNIWIGEVSWLKAGMSGDEETYIPDTVGEIHDIIGEEFPIIDDQLIKKISDAFNLPNHTSYRLQTKEKAIEFLEANKGKKAFTISW